MTPLLPGQLRYYYRILTAQGPSSDGGAKNYIQSGRMTGGFALVAWPALPVSCRRMQAAVGGLAS